MKLTVKEMVLVSMFAALACIPALLIRFGAEGVVPFSILPMIVMLSGVLLGGRLGALSMAVYVILGLAGVPVFATPPHGGLAYLFKPSAGFLFGFIAGAYVSGIVAHKIGRNTVVNYLVSAMAGLAVIYLIGIPYMYVILNFYVGKTVNVWSALKIGFLPFIGFDLLKAVIVSLIAVSVTKQVSINVKA